MANPNSPYQTVPPVRPVPTMITQGVDGVLQQNSSVPSGAPKAPSGKTGPSAPVKSKYSYLIPTPAPSASDDNKKQASGFLAGLTLGDWWKQQVEDVTAPFKYLPQLAGTVIQKYATSLAYPFTGDQSRGGAQGASLAEDVAFLINQFNSDPETFRKHRDEVVSGMWKDMTAHYRNPEGTATAQSIAEAPIRRPLLVLSDLLMLADLGATGLNTVAKSASLGGAGKIMRLLPDGSIQKAEGLAGKLQKSSEGLRFIANLPLEGLKQLALAAEKLPPIKALLGKGLGYSPLTRKISSEVTGRAELAYSQKYGRQLRDNFLDTVPPELRKHVAHVFGKYRPFIREEFAAVPGLAEKIEGYMRLEADIFGDMVSRKIQMETGEASEGLRRHADEKHYAEIARQDALDKLDPALPTTTQEIDRLSKEPFSDAELASARINIDNNLLASQIANGSDAQKGAFLPFQIQKEFNLSEAVSDLFKPSMGLRNQNIPTFRRFVPGKMIPEDPIIWQTRQVRSAIKIMTISDTVSWIRDNVAEIVDDLSKPLKKGHVLMPPIFPHILDVQKEANALAVSRILKGGKYDQQAILEALDQGAQFAYGKFPELQEALKSGKWLSVPEDVSRMLQQMVGGLGPFFRFFKTVNEAWKYIVLKINPSYYVNNIVGNSITTLIFGSAPLVNFHHAYNDMPGEVARASILTEDAPFLKSINSSGAMRKIDQASDFLSNMTDQLPRANAFTVGLERQFRELKTLQDIGHIATDKLQDLVREFGSIEQASISLRKSSIFAEPRARAALAISNDVIRQKAEYYIKRGTALSDRMKATEFDISQQVAAISDPNAKAALFNHLTSQAKQFTPDLDSIIDKLTASELRQAIEESGQLNKFLEANKPLVNAAERAIGDMEKFFGPYGKLTPLEREYIRSVIPFWTYLKTMWGVAIQLPLIRPNSYFMWRQFTNMTADAMNDERLPYWLRNSIPIGRSKSGNLIFAKVSRINPFGGVGFRRLGNIPLPDLMNPLQSPIMSVMHKVVGGVDQFTMSLEPVTTEQIIDSQGRYWEWQGDGWTKISPQTPWLEAVMDMFPQTASVNDLLASYGFRVPGLGPKIQRDENGNIQKRMWESSMYRFLVGVPMDEVDIKKANWQEDLARIRNIKLMYKKAVSKINDPEEQGNILRTLYDAMEEANVKIR